MKKIGIILCILCSLTMCSDDDTDSSLNFTNIQVSSPENYRPNEVTIAINQNNMDNIVVGSNLHFYYYTFDGGFTWSEHVLQSRYGVHGDPVVTFDLYGNLYYSHLSRPEDGSLADRIVVQKSLDGGISWNEGVGIGLDGTKLQDKEWMGIDFTNSSYADNVYIAWTEFDAYGSADPEDRSRIRFSRSTDFGETWMEPVVISDETGDCLDDDNTMEGAVPAIGPNGEVYLGWSGPDGIYFDKSLDGGQTFGTDRIVSDMPGGWGFSVPGIYRCNGMPFTVCDISDSEYRGNIYIMWSDQRNGSNNTDVFLIKSSDRGNTWRERIKVNDDETVSHQFFPNIVIDQTTGYIYIAFYDRRNYDGVETDIYLARSVDGGESFANYKISNSHFIPYSGVFFGDYIDIDAHDGLICPVWMRMDDSRMSVWAALIHDFELD